MKDQEESLGLGIYGEGWAKAFLLRIQVSGALKEMVDKLASIENENFSEQKNAIFKVKKKPKKQKRTLHGETAKELISLIHKEQAHTN